MTPTSTDSRSYSFGLVGLGAMGRNFLLNLASNNFSAAGLDIGQDKVDQLLSEGKDLPVWATTQMADFVASLEAPRKILLMVPAGDAVDGVLRNLTPLLATGDVVIDGGNSHFGDTQRRTEELAAKELTYLGMGISGGVEGARRGPSFMVGGNPEAYESLRPQLEVLSAKLEGTPSVAQVGQGAAGHYVKMVHNGIEYAMMELLAEAYSLMKYSLRMGNEDIAKAFDQWNHGRLNSFLVEISAKIMRKADDLVAGELIDAISDAAGQKGTGKWMSQNAMDLGVPVPSIDASVGIRSLSSYRPMREALHTAYTPIPLLGEASLELEDVEEVLYGGFLLAFAQGFHQLAVASAHYGFQLNLGTIARIWRGGSIIRAEMLKEVGQCFEGNDPARHLLLAPSMAPSMPGLMVATQAVVTHGIQHCLPLPAMSATLQYFQALTAGPLPLNLVQAQRDYFGSHTYQRNDREGVFHTDWGTIGA